MISSWSKTVPLGAIKLFDVSHRRAARISERVCELHPPAEDPSPRPSPTGRGSINRRIRVVDVYRMAPRFEFTDTLSGSREELCGERGDRRLKDTARGYQHDVQE